MASSTATDEYRLLVRFWLRSLRTAERSPRTLQLYGIALRSLERTLRERGMPLSPQAITGEHIRVWLEDLAERHLSQATRRVYSIAVGLWCAWLVTEGERPDNPCTNIVVPAPEPPPVPVLSEATLRRILKACSGTSFAERRDHAIIRLLFDTGLRRTECANIQVGDIDWDTDTIRVMGKGRRPRTVHYGDKTAQALLRYRRARRDHKHAALPAWWLGRQGGLGGATVYMRVKIRAQQAGIGEKVWTHMLRHYFAHKWLQKGGQETDLMRLAGWKRRDQLERYGAALADERAIDAHKRHAPGDDV